MPIIKIMAMRYIRLYSVFIFLPFSLCTFPFFWFLGGLLVYFSYSCAREMYSWGLEVYSNLLLRLIISMKGFLKLVGVLS